MVQGFLPLTHLDEQRLKVTGRPSANIREPRNYAWVFTTITFVTALKKEGTLLHFQAKVFTHRRGLVKNF